MTDTAVAGRKPAPDKSVDDLLSGFSLATPAPQEDRYEVARKARVKQAEADVAALAQSLVDLAKGTGDEDAIKGALVSLQTVRQRAVKAIKALPDEAMAGGSTPGELGEGWDTETGDVPAQEA